MAINRSSISAEPISQNYDVAIKMLATPPDVQQILSPAVVPNILHGYYNDALGIVELYVTSFDGTRYIRIK